MKTKKNIAAAQLRVRTIRLLQFQGLSIREMARHLKVSQNTIRQDMGLPKLPAGKRNKLTIQ
jgi:transposase